MHYVNSDNLSMGHRVIEIECPACQSTDYVSLFSVQGSDLVKCKHCELIYVPSPLPEVSAVYRNEDTYSDERAEGMSEYADDLSAKFRTYESELLLLEAKIGGKGRLLEFGCRHGHFGAMAKVRGWDTFVTDYSEAMVQRAHTDYGLSGFVTPTNKVPVKEGQFDIIALHDILERVSHPYEMLKEIVKGLDARGYVVITTPDTSSFWAKIFKMKWLPFKNDEQLMYFKPSNLKILLARVGLEVKSVQTHFEYLTFGEYFIRLGNYFPKLSRLLLSIFKLLGRDRQQIHSRSGKMYIMAQKKGSKPSRKVFSVDLEPTPILGVVCCPHCKGALYPKPGAIHCVGCEFSYEIEAGIINFSKYVKRSKSSVS